MAEQQRTLYHLIRARGLKVETVRAFVALALQKQLLAYKLEQINGTTPFERREQIRRAIASPDDIFVTDEIVFFQGGEMLGGMEGTFYVYYNWSPPMLGENQMVDQKSQLWDLRRIYPLVGQIVPFATNPSR